MPVRCRRSPCHSAGELWARVRDRSNHVPLERIAKLLEKEKKALDRKP